MKNKNLKEEKEIEKVDNSNLEVHREIRAMSINTDNLTALIEALISRTKIIRSELESEKEEEQEEKKKEVCELAEVLRSYNQRLEHSTRELQSIIAALQI
jgi:hypothetical protein